MLLSKLHGVGAFLGLRSRTILNSDDPPAARLVGFSVLGNKMKL